ncbi:MAG: hypothetical protein B7Z58_02465 [Acidiphilium sp. 37-64-53]|uniref:hypothetical protein n=1 Tax=Acidiphilium TaxID=522 RepID=UPI000BCBBF88|nr:MULTISPECIES: hypothetical protein [Acidiphilium]OYW03800.1 MAG: hypothetical protein B7Z58_02465 [Acidiphilium sp. 37-64-53]OZB28814.1 MAG: hypothetical protein B7X49_09500 [Acidiphilium sp. 34-64-41]HQT83515.1 hypothetical protein [Acidiphilium rubrum]
MTKMTFIAVVAATLSLATPLIAQAAPSPTQHDQLVQKINNAYGTQFATNAPSVTAPGSNR